MFGLLNEENEWKQDGQLITTIVSDYYNVLFSYSQPLDTDINWVL